MDSGRVFYAGLLQTLTRVMGSAKGYLHDHGPQVALLASRLGRELGLDDVQRSELVFAAVLSDLGMVGLAEDAWENPVLVLPDDVRARVERHPQRSEERVRKSPHLAHLAPLVRHHHEWWDGNGYPDRLRGGDIPLGARVLRLADTVVALGGPRPFRGALSRAEIAETVTAGLGGEFGPEVARAFLALDRADAVPRFSREAFSRALFDAAEHLLPSAVSPLSNNQLLTIVANLIDAKDPYTGGHSRRVAMLAVAVADELRLDADLRSHLWAVGYLHDLGKVAVPLRVLAKTSGLSTEELALIRAHPGDGARILQEVEPLQQLTTGVRHHHERWDGRGYPDGLSGHRIPLIAQVIAVCDAYDAMTSRRAYRDSLDPEFARCEVERQSGRQFGPTVAEAFLAVPGETLERIQGMRPPAIADFREPVQALRRIDPRWLGPSPVGMA